MGDTDTDETRPERAITPGEPLDSPDDPHTAGGLQAAMGDQPTPVPRRWPVLGVVTAGATMAVLLFWWVAYHPGLFSPDSLDYLKQASTGDWNTHHPIAYTALVWLALQLTGGVAALTLAQIAATAAGLGYTVTGLRRLGGPGWLWFTSAVVLTALPPIGTLLVVVWKDVAFVIAYVFLLGTLARIVARHRDGVGPATSRSLQLALLAELTLCCLFRQNGFLAVAITIALCALLLRGERKRLLVAGATAVTVALSVNWLLLPGLGVREAESVVAYESFFSDIAVGYAADPGSFSAADLGVMASVAPLTLWRDSANCSFVDPTVHSPAFDRRAAARKKSELMAVWWSLARRAPGTVFGARVCRGAIAWQPTPTPDVRRNPHPWSVRSYVARDAAFQASPARDAAYSRPLSQRAQSYADRLNAATVEPQWLLWRGATWAYLSYLLLAIAALRRRDRSLLALGTLSLGVQLSLLPVNAVQAARYVVVPMVIGILLLPVVLARPRLATPRPAGQPPATPRTGDSAPQEPPGDQRQARLDERG
ncbi:DUF6020 family protein [Plantactinospora sp. GCM10030261]|uniref:DUF6020 family protein n=1 Tax=Plantactinospora sp. GCM10030261 TaxID=3273420 RepID=UPI0036097B47